MAIPAAVGIGVGLIPSLFKAVSGIRQLNQANRMNPNDPGYQMNTGVIDNARVLGERATNYTMPGYTRALNNINLGTSQAFNQGIEGATSGGDVLDLATKLAYGQNQRLNDLALRNAEGADNALLMGLEAKALAGQEYVNKNAYDRDIYQQQLREKAALRQAGNENLYGAVDTAASIGTNLLNPKKSINSTLGLTDEQKALQAAHFKSLNPNG